MKFEEVLHALREDKALYNSKFDSYLALHKEQNSVFPDIINQTLVDHSGCRFEFFAELLLSEHWNIVEKASN